MSLLRYACYVLLVSGHTPSMRLNYTAVPCHCCWHSAFTCFKLSPFGKMNVSFSTVLVSVHLAISIFISLKYRQMMLRGALHLFSFLWYIFKNAEMKFVRKLSVLVHKFFSLFQGYHNEFLLGCWSSRMTCFVVGNFCHNLTFQSSVTPS